MKLEITKILQQIEPVDASWLARAQRRQEILTKPPGSLGRLEEIGNRLAAIHRSLHGGSIRKRMYVVAADHGVTAEGVSAYPREVTAQMVLNFLRGGAAINVLARYGGIEVQVVDAGVDADFEAQAGLMHHKVVRGTANFTRGPALTRAQAEACIEAGIDLARQSKRDGVGLLGLGEMGIGNSTSASAVAAVLTGRSPAEVTGRGTGLDDEAWKRKVSVIERALEVNQPDRSDPIGVLAKVGGAEIGVMMGAYLGGAAEQIALVADGFISTSAAALAVALCPGVREYLTIAHLSVEEGHKALTELIRLEPLLDLQLRLGEGTGAALAMHVMEASAKLLSEMATFAEAGVSDKAE